MPVHPLPHPFSRRSALATTLGLLAWPATRALAASPPSAPELWPRASLVPGGVARLSLGPAAQRPVARTPDGRYTVSAGNVVHLADGESLLQRVEALSHLDKNELKAAFKAQLRQPRDTLTGPGAGLGLIDMARKASEPLAATVQALPDGLSFFSLRVTL